MGAGAEGEGRCGGGWCVREGEGVGSTNQGTGRAEEEEAAERARMVVRGVERAARAVRAVRAQRRRACIVVGRAEAVERVSVAAACK